MYGDVPKKYGSWHGKVPQNMVPQNMALPDIAYLDNAFYFWGVDQHLKPVGGFAILGPYPGWKEMR